MDKSRNETVLYNSSRTTNGERKQMRPLSVENGQFTASLMTIHTLTFDM